MSEDCLVSCGADLTPKGINSNAARFRGSSNHEPVAADVRQTERNQSPKESAFLRRGLPSSMKPLSI